MEWYHVWWPWLTSKCIARFVSDSWVSCFYFSVLNKLTSMLEIFVICVLHRPDFWQKAFTVAHRHQNNLSIQSTWHSVTRSVHRVASGWVTGQRFRPSSISELEICCWIVHTLHMHCRDGFSLTKAKNKIQEIVASTYVMISGNVHIYAWLREAYVSAKVIVCVCTISAA